MCTQVEHFLDYSLFLQKAVPMERDRVGLDELVYFCDAICACARDISWKSAMSVTQIQHASVLVNQIRRIYDVERPINDGFRTEIFSRRGDEERVEGRILKVNVESTGLYTRRLPPPR